MTFKISKTQEAEINDLMNAAATAVDSLRAFLRDDVLSPLRSEWDEKTEKWQEGDAGQAAESWLTEWDEFVDGLPEFNEWPGMAP